MLFFMLFQRVKFFPEKTGRSITEIDFFDFVSFKKNQIVFLNKKKTDMRARDTKIRSLEILKRTHTEYLNYVFW